MCGVLGCIVLAFMRLLAPWCAAFPVAALVAAAVGQTPANRDLGFTDTPMLPGLPYHVHDPGRPHPPVVTPARQAGGAPSDAIVLFDGHDLSKWTSAGGAPRWLLGDGFFEVVDGTGDLPTREKFGDCQLHVEWASPMEVKGSSQGRGNSGVLLMSLFELQVLDSYNNPTYADGQAGAIYGQWPPLANAVRQTGEWNAYDIVFEAPRFEGQKLVKPAMFTAFLNGVLVQNHKESMGPMVYRKVAHYAPIPPEAPLALQNHHNPVRYRNIWVRRPGGYDQPGK